MGNLASIINQGLIFSLVAMAVYLTSRVIKKDDLTVEGSFGLGGAITGIMLHHHCSPLLAIATSLIGGALAGSCTGVLYARLKMNHLMAGLVTTTACFSLSLALASANRIIAANRTIFGQVPMVSEPMAEIICLSLMSLFFLVAIRQIFCSEIGLLLRACGENADILVHFGKSSPLYQTMGFTLANAVTAVSGSLFVQWSGFFSITGNIGTLVTGLASLMIAELISKTLGSTIIISAIAYQSIFAATLFIGIDPVWNNVVKAVIMVLLVVMSKKLTKIRAGERYA